VWWGGDLMLRGPLGISWLRRVACSKPLHITLSECVCVCERERGERETENQRDSKCVRVCILCVRAGVCVCVCVSSVYDELPAMSCPSRSLADCK